MEKMRSGSGKAEGKEYLEDLSKDEKTANEIGFCEVYYDTTEINDRRRSAALTTRHPSIHKNWH
jgi:hypothetical protein